MLVLLTNLLYIHIEDPKGMQFALKYEIFELKRLRQKNGYQCRHNSPIHGCQAVRGGCLSLIIVKPTQKYNRLYIWNSSTVMPNTYMHSKHMQVKHVSNSGPALER